MDEFKRDLGAALVVDDIIGRITRLLDFKGLAQAKKYHPAMYRLIQSD